MVTVPPALLEALNLQAGSTVAIAIDGGRLVVSPIARPHHTLAELLAASEYGDASDDEREWVDAPAIGREHP